MLWNVQQGGELVAAPQVQEVAGAAEEGEDLSGVPTLGEEERDLEQGNVDIADKKDIPEPIALIGLETEFWF